MPPTVSERVSEKRDRIDLDNVLSKYPWLHQEGLDAILSPDSDGLLCGLLMSHARSWRIRGFYDGKVLVCDSRIKPSQCVFLDMEIFRSGVRSMGQHMLMYNRNRIPDAWDNFDQCLSANNLRQHDGCHDFQLKYPFGTIHLLLLLVNHFRKIEIPRTAVAPLLFTDGTYHNLFRYTENSLNWLHYLRYDEANNPLYAIFSEDQYTLDQLMQGMNNFWRARDEISNVPGERGDRVAITPRGGDRSPRNLEKHEGQYRLQQAPKERAEQFISLLSESTGWHYNPSHWSWGCWSKFLFSASSFQSDKLRINGNNFNALIDKRPLSFAMTSGQNIEYTLEEPDQLA